MNIGDLFDQGGWPMYLIALALLTGVLASVTQLVVRSLDLASLLVGVICVLLLIGIWGTTEQLMVNFQSLALVEQDERASRFAVWGSSALASMVFSLFSAVIVTLLASVALTVRANKRG